MPSALNNSQVHPGSTSPSSAGTSSHAASFFAAPPPSSYPSSSSFAASSKHQRLQSFQSSDPSATLQQLDLLRSFLDSAAGDQPSTILVKELVALASRHASSRRHSSSPSRAVVFDSIPPANRVEEEALSPSASTGTSFFHSPSDSSSASSSNTALVGGSSRAADYAPVAGAEVLLVEDYFAEDGDDDDTDAGQHSEGRRRERKTANVPKLDDFVLDADGVFVPKATIRKSVSVRSSKAETSFNREDSVMDRRRAVSYVNVSNQEKRDVFKLSAVRRSMRHLSHSNILMSDEVLTLANKYLEIGPSRASLLQIGYESIQLSCPERTFYDELGFISPYLKAVGILRGYHPVTFVLTLLTALCDFGFFGLNAYRKGTVDTVTGPILVSTLFFMVFNLHHCYFPAFVGEPLTASMPVEEATLTGIGYLQLKGLDVIAKAQQRMARDKKKTLSPDSDLSVFKKNVVNSTIIEAVTLHFLFGMVFVSCSTAATVVRSFQRGDDIVAFLALGALGNKFFMMLVNVNVAITTRLAQKMSEFEIRRVEADIRTITPNLIHRVTPRFKSLLHECHMTGHLASGGIILVGIVTVVNTIQLLGAILQASFGTAGKDDSCVPAWTFASVFQPIISIVIFVHYFGLANLLVERDIDQDIVESNIRLTFSDSHVPNWLLQQMICLERLDGRAFSLPFNLIPSVDMSRSMVNNIVAVCLFLGPYLLSIYSQLSAELLCPAAPRQHDS